MGQISVEITGHNGSILNATIQPIEGTVLALTKRDEVLWEKLEAIIGGAPLLRLLAI